MAVAIRTPADATQLGSLRALVETVCLVTDFGIDAAADIRIAVDEAAAALMLSAVPGADIGCEFSCDEWGMTVRVDSVVDTAASIDVHGLGWYVLHALTDTVELTAHPFDSAAAGIPVDVRFSFNRIDLANRARTK